MFINSLSFLKSTKMMRGYEKNSNTIFYLPLFLLSCYKIKICQKDTVENHLKIQVLLKNQN